MPSSPKSKIAFAHFQQAFAGHRLPHAVLVNGAPRGAGGDFAEQLLSLPFQETNPARLRAHVDIRWIEPESKSRQITMDDQIRPLLDFIALTSYEGGWKAAVMLFADRLNINAQHALLKTLEEPPPRSLLILVTDIPAALLPTIRSRTQYVDVTSATRDAAAPWLETILDLLRNPPLRQAIDMIAWTDRLTAPLRELKALAEADETAAAEQTAQAQGGESTLSEATTSMVEGRVATRVKEMREDILRTILLWQRDVLAAACQGEATPANFPDEAAAIAAQAHNLPFAEAAARVDAIEEVRRLMEHNIRDEVALLRLARALSSPPQN